MWQSCRKSGTGPHPARRNDPLRLNCIHPELDTRRLCLCFPLFTLFFLSNVQALHKPTIYIGLKFKRWSNLGSQVAASSTLPTLRACEWGMMGAVLSAGERQRLADAFVKQAGGKKNPKITAAPCGSPFRIREPSRWDSQTDNSIRRAGFTGENFAFMCLCIINSNGIMILRFLDVLKCFGPSNIPTPWFERQPGLGKDEAHNFAVFYF